LPLAAGLAARNAAAEISRDESIQLKWPNDLIVPVAGGDRKSPLRKLAGLLCERVDTIDLIGIGVNVNVPARLPPKNLRDRVIYLEQLAGAGSELSLTASLLTLARHLHTMLVRKSETPFPSLLREYDRHHALVGRNVTIRSATEAAITGRCEGLDDTGRLLVRDRRKRLHPIIAGHVELA
jgi:BirA family biotin operon repressor/biotin-[acetyl-CoA-carboxylase] ligase